MDAIERRENKVRRQLARDGLLLRKSRTGGFITRNGIPSALCDDHGGYMVIDGTINSVVAGAKFDMTLEDVEQFAAGEDK